MNLSYGLRSVCAQDESTIYLKILNIANCNICFDLLNIYIIMHI